MLPDMDVRGQLQQWYVFWDQTSNQTIKDISVTIYQVSRHAYAGIEVMTHQSLCEEVNRERIRVWEELWEGSLFAEGEGTDVVAWTTGCDGIELIERWRAEDVKNECKLMVVVTTREERFAREHFGKDTPYRPDVDCLLRVYNDWWGWIEKTS